MFPRAAVRDSVLRALHALALLPSLQAKTAWPLPLAGGAAVLLAHLAGVLLVARLAHWPLPLTACALLGLIALSIDHTQHAAHNPFHTSRITLDATRLAPLVLVFLVAGLRLIIAFIARAQGAATGSLVVPQPWGGWLNLNWAFAFGAIWSVAIRLPAAWRGRAGTTGLAALAFGWAGYAYFRSAPAGVTGSDPYVYVQMAVDLAERGTLLHSFPLAAVARDLGLPIYPTLHVGYRLPDAFHLSASVWPPGYSALLAGAYRVFGERGLYLANPALGLASLGATLWLAGVLFRGHPQRWTIGALAALWLATSPEQTTRLLVPLADIAAQLFTALTLCLIFLPRPERGRIAPLCGQFRARAFMTGLAFGWAYFVRYTQLLIAPAILYMAQTGIGDRTDRAERRRRLTYLFMFGLGALFVVLPDLWYHQLAFGSPFRAGSQELVLFRLDAVPAMAGQMAREVFAPREFLRALPFIALGTAAMRREHRRELIALALAFGPLVLFHLPYPYLRLRDLLPLFPVIALIGAFGVVEVIRRLMARSAGVRIVTIALLLAAPLARWQSAWPLARGFFTFGTLFPEQRAALGDLANLTPSDAVIAASLNSGAIELYSRRETIRPAIWTEAEFEAFVSALRADRREAYLLDDGVELAPIVARLQAAGRLTEVATLPGVYFQREGGASQNLDLKLYRIEAMIDTLGGSATIDRRGRANSDTHYRSN